jgi:hypothetical protein
MQYIHRLNPINPHQRGGGIAQYTAGASSIAGGNNCCKESYMQSFFIYHQGDAASDHCRSNVIQKGRQYHYAPKEDQTASPVIG